MLTCFENNKRAKIVLNAMGELSSFLIYMIRVEHLFSGHKISKESVAKYAIHYQMVRVGQLPHGGGKRIVLESGGQSVLSGEF